MDARVEQLVDDFRKGYLTRRGFLAKAAALGFSSAAALGLAQGSSAEAAETQTARVRPKRWQKGKGWGWVWGSNDQIGNLNELSPELTLKALRLVKRGRVYDLGLTYDRRSARWPGHAPGEIVTFRTPSGLQTQKDLSFVTDQAGNTTNAAWVSHAMFISDNVATQIDGFGHFFEGNPSHSYNGFRASDVVGDFGLMKLGIENVPPIVAPATVIDVAGLLEVPHLPENFEVGPEILQRALARQKVDIEPLDVVLLRYGAAGVWLKGEGVGANHDEVAVPNSAGLTVSGARWLVEEKGALAVGADDVDVELFQPKEQLEDGTSFNPVHNYLLVRQGVHILEFHNLEELVAEKTYKFAYILGVNKIKGAAAGTVQRPIGIA
jgi:kynurenine formamidase